MVRIHGKFSDLYPLSSINRRQTSFAVIGAASCLPLKVPWGTQLNSGTQWTWNKFRAITMRTLQDQKPIKSTAPSNTSYTISVLTSKRSRSKSRNRKNHEKKLTCVSRLVILGSEPNKYTSQVDKALYSILFILAAFIRYKRLTSAS